MPVPSYTTSDSSFFHIFPPYILYPTLNQHLSQSWLCREFSVGIIPWCGHVLSPIIRSRCVSIQWIGFPMNWYLFHFISLNISWACHLLGKFSNRYWYTDIYIYIHTHTHIYIYTCEWIYLLYPNTNDCQPSHVQVRVVYRRLTRHRSSGPSLAIAGWRRWRPAENMGVVSTKTWEYDLGYNQPTWFKDLLEYLWVLQLERPVFERVWGYVHYHQTTCYPKFWTTIGFDRSRRANHPPVKIWAPAKHRFQGFLFSEQSHFGPKFHVCPHVFLALLPVDHQHIKSPWKKLRNGLQALVMQCSSWVMARESRYTMQHPSFGGWNGIHPCLTTLCGHVLVDLVIWISHLDRVKFSWLGWVFSRSVADIDRVHAWLVFVQRCIWGLRHGS